MASADDDSKGRREERDRKQLAQKADVWSTDEVLIEQYEWVLGDNPDGEAGLFFDLAHAALRQDQLGIKGRALLSSVFLQISSDEALARKILGLKGRPTNANRVRIDLEVHMDMVSAMENGKTWDEARAEVAQKRFLSESSIEKAHKRTVAFLNAVTNKG